MFVDVVVNPCSNLAFVFSFVAGVLVRLKELKEDSIYCVFEEHNGWVYKGEIVRRRGSTEVVVGAIAVNVNVGDFFEDFTEVGWGVWNKMFESAVADPNHLIQNDCQTCYDPTMTY